MLKRYIFLFFIALFASSCVAPTENPSLLPPSTLTTATDSPTVIPLTPTPEKTFVPKRNDLIFIEFFAIT